MNTIHINKPQQERPGDKTPNKDQCSGIRRSVGVGAVVVAMLLAGCENYAPETPTVSISDLNRDGLTVTVKNVRLKKKDANKTGPEFYYASQAINLTHSGAGGGSCSINIKKANAAIDRPESDSDILPTQCEFESNTDHIQKVKYACSALTANGKDFSCVVTGLNAGYTYAFNVETNIQIKDGNNISANKITGNSAAVRTPQLPETKIIVAPNGDRRAIQIVKNGMGLEVGEVLPVNIGKITGEVWRTEEKFSNIVVDKIDKLPRIDDIVVADLNEDGYEDVIAVRMDGDLLLLMGTASPTRFNYNKDVDFGDIKKESLYAGRIVVTKINQQKNCCWQTDLKKHSYCLI